MEQHNISANQNMNPNMRIPSNNKKLIIICIILLLLVGLGSYFLGAKSEQNKQAAIVQNTPHIESTPTSVLTLTPINSPVPTKHLIINQIANWKTYTNVQYGFSFQYPPDWTVSEGQNGVSVVDSQKNALGIGVKRQGDSTRIMRTGVGAGNIIEKGSVIFLSMSIPRNVVVWQGNDKSVLYKNAAEISASNLVFTLSLDNMSGDYGNLSQTAEDIADKIIKSLQLIH